MIELILLVFGVWILALIILVKQAYSRIEILKDDLKFVHNKLALLETKL